MNGTSHDHPASVLRLREQFIEELEQQILDIGLSLNGRQSLPKSLWTGTGGTIYCQLCLSGRPLNLPNGDHLLEAKTYDDLVEQLDAIKIIAGFGGLDGPLSACETLS
jgi:hypothetical protein